MDEERAVAVLNHFRACHSQPLLKVRMGLTSFVKGASVEGVVTQRLKRQPRIIRKLLRMPKSQLARLEDVGGCRVVVGDGAELVRLRSHLVKKWCGDITRERDYITDPKDIGYRAVHIVVERDFRKIEVQLRTEGQQSWADAVEAADSRHNLNLKDGDGPDEMVEYFKVSRELIYTMEYKLDRPAELRRRFRDARRAVVDAGYYSRQRHTGAETMAATVHVLSVYSHDRNELISGSPETPPSRLGKGALSGAGSSRGRQPRKRGVRL